MIYKSLYDVQEKYFPKLFSGLKWEWDEDEPAPESGDSDGDGPIILDGDDDCGEDSDEQ